MSYKLGDTVVYNLLGTWYSGIVHGINGPQLLISQQTAELVVCQLALILSVFL